jgi:Zn-dependent protease
MNFFGYSLPLGRYFGINVRLHFTFLLYAFSRVSDYGHVGFGLTYVGGLYFSILLHEFGHALAARWCDGDATDILLWPLGGLAFVRPAFNPTAHLITTVAGPFVTLVLWLCFWGAMNLLTLVFPSPTGVIPYVYWFCGEMRELNLWLLIFNLIPAFPMDGGRILRDTLWHWLSAEKATDIAVWVSRLIAGVAVIWALSPLVNGGRPHLMLVFAAAFILLQGSAERYAIRLESSAVHNFSIRDRWRRGRKQRQFRQAIHERTRQESTMAFHRCATCGVTEIESPTMDFRVCPDCSAGQEYCRAHLDIHPHV